jgi:photosystem II stability/assembly factor-like uncharacterized protein
VVWILSDCGPGATLRRWFLAGVVVFVLGGAQLPARAQEQKVSSVRREVVAAHLAWPDFGYAVQYRTVSRAGDVTTSVSLFVFAAGRRRDVTPPQLRRDGISSIDAVTFVDREHGWVVGFNCAKASVAVYRTADSGRSWQPLGSPSGHSCGGGPTYLSFVNHADGWIEPVSPNGPVGALLGTRDGGRTWTQILAGDPGQRDQLPCLAPIRFLSATVGWMARCGSDLFRTSDGGRDWVRVLHTRALDYDLPSFSGERGVLAATRIVGAPNGAAVTGGVVFATTTDRGSHWSTASTRRIDQCDINSYRSTLWPSAIASNRVWWIAAGRRHVTVQRTTDAGRRWQTVIARGLPAGHCTVREVSAADATHAWVNTRLDAANSALFATRDGGKTWRRILG